MMRSSDWEIISLKRKKRNTLLTSFLEAAALCKGVNHIWSLAFTLAPVIQKQKHYYILYYIVDFNYISGDTEVE